MIENEKERLTKISNFNDIIELINRKMAKNILIFIFLIFLSNKFYIPSKIILSNILSIFY